MTQPGRTKTIEVAGFTAEVSIPQLEHGAVGSAVVIWSPRKPDLFHDLTEEQRRSYRGQLVRAIAEMLA